MSGYDPKQSDGEVILKPLGMRTTPSLSSLPGLLWLGVVISDRVLTIGQIELNSIHIQNRVL